MPISVDVPANTPSTFLVSTRAPKLGDSKGLEAQTVFTFVPEEGHFYRVLSELQSSADASSFEIKSTVVDVDTDAPILVTQRKVWDTYPFECALPLDQMEPKVFVSELHSDDSKKRDFNYMRTGDPLIDSGSEFIDFSLLNANIDDPRYVTTLEWKGTTFNAGDRVELPSSKGSRKPPEGSGITEFIKPSRSSTGTFLRAVQRRSTLILKVPDGYPIDIAIVRWDAQEWLGVDDKVYFIEEFVGCVHVAELDVSN